MTTTLIVTIAITALLITVYFFLLLRFHRRRQSKSFEKAESLFAKTIAEKPIFDSPIYRDTKDKVTLLRSSLDTFRQHFDVISRLAQNGSVEELDTAYASGLPEMHRSLVTAKKTAIALSSTVQNKVLEEPLAEPIHGEAHCSPSSLPPESVVDLSQIYHLWTELVYCVDNIDPCVAGFYYALSSPDERIQRAQAAAHIEMLIHYLDEALAAMIGLEKKLTLR